MEERKATGALQWRKTTCGEVRKMKDVGLLVFWRPDFILNYKDPDQDVAFYAAP